MHAQLGTPYLGAYEDGCAVLLPIFRHWPINSSVCLSQQFMERGGQKLEFFWENCDRNVGTFKVGCALFFGEKATEKEKNAIPYGSGWANGEFYPFQEA